MSIKNRIIGFIISVICSLLISCKPSGSEKANEASMIDSAPIESEQTVIKKGEYLVTVMGCHDCHSPKKFGSNGPEPDPELLLSGHPQKMPIAKVDTAMIGPWVMFNASNTAIVGPWGVSFAANLTSDETGIGNWTEEQFARALREGKSKGLTNNRNLLPPMPWPNYVSLKDEDLKAIFAYLQSVKPVKNIPPQPRPLAEISSLYIK